MDFITPRKRLHAPAIDGTRYSGALTDLKLFSNRSSSAFSSPSRGSPSGAGSPSPPSDVPGTPSNRPASPRSHEMALSGGWIVQKYGGTSVGKFAQGIAGEIITAGLRENRIAVVCSARSTSTKTEGTTNRLLRAASEAAKPKSIYYHDIVNVIKEDHNKAAREVISSQRILEKLSKEIEDECEDLVRVLEAAQRLEEMSAGAEDRIVSAGEKLSCRFMTALLQANGVDAVYVDMSNLMKPTNSAKEPPRLDEAFYTDVAKKLGEAVHKALQNHGDNAVPVITGYFGRLPGGLLRKIGRGYTDLCAALVAVGLESKELQVWKEVDGIFTADPRKVPTARLLASVTPSEAAELTFYGSEVIHPFTMERVIRAKIPIRVKNVMNPECKGTMIFPDPAEEGSTTTMKDSRMPRKRYSFRRGARQRPKRPTAVTVKHKIIILNVHSNKRTRSHGFLMNIFSILDQYHLTVDLISSSEVHVSMALHSESGMLSDAEDDEDEVAIQDSNLLGAVNELREFGSIDLVNNMAIVSLVGKQLRNMVGISGKFFKTLGDNNINIEMISQGASEINISCVIDERDADRALSYLHTSLFTFLD